MTELLLRMPRNLPTVAFDASAVVAAGLRPTTTWAPLTACTRPITLRFAGAVAGVAAVAATGAAVGAAANCAAGVAAGVGDVGWGCRSGAAVGGREKLESIATPGWEQRAVAPRNGGVATVNNPTEASWRFC